MFKLAAGMKQTWLLSSFVVDAHYPLCPPGLFCQQLIENCWNETSIPGSCVYASHPGTHCSLIKVLQGSNQEGNLPTGFSQFY